MTMTDPTVHPRQQNEYRRTLIRLSTNDMCMCQSNVHPSKHATLLCDSRALLTALRSEAAAGAGWERVRSLNPLRSDASASPVSAMPFLVFEICGHRVISSPRPLAMPSVPSLQQRAGAREVAAGLRTRGDLPSTG